MAAQRGKSQAKRNGSSSAWTWLIAGLIIGILAFFISTDLMKKDGDNFLRPKPNPDASPAAASSEHESIGATPNAEPAQRPAQYDFYTLLPNRKGPVTNLEPTEQPPKRETAPADNQRPTPLDEMAKALMNTPTPKTKPPAATTVASNESAYSLQVGSFSTPRDAENVKAKIALLGLTARVEPGSANGRTLYRVRLGPYKSNTELTEVKRKLANGGLPSMTMKTQ